MKSLELDRLLQGAPGATVVLVGPDDARIELYLNRRTLASRARLRAALRAIACDPPDWSREEHDDVLRVLFRLADSERERRVA